MDDTPDRPILGDFAAGNPELARRARGLLQVLKQRSPDPAISTWADDILAGRASLTSGRSPLMNGDLIQRMHAAKAEFDALPDDEKQSQIEQGRLQLETLVQEAQSDAERDSRPGRN